MLKASIALETVAFGPAEMPLAEAGGLSASVFRYPTGVAALRLRNAVGEIVCLPYQGQQVADAVFHGRRLTMRSMFGDPPQASHYLGNSGGFLIHCGATAMGNPQPADTHPLHGELPNLPYQSAALLIGEDAGGPWMGMTGVGRYTVAFTHNYEARPFVALRADDARIDAAMEIRNLKHTPMELMYLAHANFRPHDGASLIDTVADDAVDIRLRTTLPQGLFAANAAHAELLAALAADPGAHRHLTPGRAIDPEIVMGLAMRADPGGWAHAMQLLPDGSADVISHRPAELPRGIRWITRNADQDALGLFLPGTAEADGYLAEKAKGNIVVLAPGASFRCALRLGALAADAVPAMRERILRARSG